MDSICRSVFLLKSWTWSFPVEGISAVTHTRSSLVSYNRKKQKQHADKQCLFSKYLAKRNQHILRIYSCTMDPMETIDTTFSFHARLSVLRTETSHFRWNLFVFDGSNGLFRGTFDPLTRLDDIFLSVSRAETLHLRRNQFVSDGSDGLHQNEFRLPRTG